MRIEPTVHTSQLQHSISDPIRPTSLRKLDSISSHQEHAANPTSGQAPAKSPLQVIIDLFQCVKYFLISSAQKLMQTLFSCLFKQKPIPAPPTASTSSTLPNPTGQPPAAPSEPARQSPQEVVDTTRPTPLPPTSSTGSADPARARAAAEEDAAFNALERTDADEGHISFIMHTLATTLVLPTTELTQRGEATRHVHPLRFLEYVLKNPTLAQDFRELQRRCTLGFFEGGTITTMIWNAFTSELSEKLTSQLRAGTLLAHVNAFARSTGRNPEEIRTRIVAQNWTGLIEHLIASVPSATVPTAPIAITRPSATTLPTTRASLEQPVANPPPPSVPPLLLPEGDSFTSVLDTPEGPIARGITGGESFSLTTRPVAAPEVLDPIDLHMSEALKAKLRRVFNDIAHHSYLNLLWNIQSLRADWKELEGVHPFKLLLTVFKDPLLMANLRAILAEPLKKEEFLNDFAKTLKHGARPDQLRPYLNSFATQMSALVATLDGQVMTGRVNNWKHVIIYLFNGAPPTG